MPVMDGRVAALASVAAAAAAVMIWWKCKSLSPEGASGAAASHQAARSNLVSNRPIASGIERKVKEALRPTQLLIHDDSAAHRGHAGVAGSNIAETHFRVEVISPLFEGVSKIERQRKVQDLLKDEFAAGLHALELICRTPAEQSRLRT
ncbi:Protein BOLA1 [Durusdinium trenchii]|uniref:Chloroplastic n=1 Tax=Durusdinium trenchii TaxID=1381693 RepID=A0ABP0P6B9_9DINO